MRKFISIPLIATLSFVVPMILSSCSAQSFKGISDKMRPPNNLPATGAATGGSTGGPPTGPGGGGTPPRNTQIINGEVCVNDIPTVDIALVVDRSGTMSGQIRAVRDGLANFTSAIQRTNLPGFNKPISKLRFTLIAYEDVTYDNVTWFNGGPWAAGDPQIQTALETQFSKVNSRATDMPEGGIMAVREALQIFNAQQEESVKVVVLVTDAYMHDGTGSQDQRYGGFSTLDSVFASPKMKPFMLFSSSSNSNDGGGDFVDGTEKTYENIGHGTAQIQAMRQHYKKIANVPDAYVGEEFVPVNNFNSDSLSGLVAGKIAAGIKKCP